MKNLKTNIFIVLAAGFILTGCEGSEGSLVNSRLEDNPLPETPNYTSGSTDFSTFVTIGNSLTAGYMDGALYTSGQNNSLSALLAAQFAPTVGEDFEFLQPDINSVNGFNTAVSPNPNNGVTFGRFKLDPSIPGPSPTINGTLPQPYTGPTVNNYGVPGIVVGQLLTPFTGGPAAGNPAFNPFYARFASNPGSSTILNDAIAKQPTFFSLWIGNNDVLGYAVSGGSRPEILTSDNDFQNQFNLVVNSLMTQTQADGIVANIPPFLGLAFFRAVGHNIIPLDAPNAAGLNQAYAQYNGGLQQARQNSLITEAEANRRTISFAAGANNRYVIEDESLTDLSGLGLPNLRQAEPTDLAVLSLGAVLGQDLGDGPYGLADPVEDRFILIPAEQIEIETKRQNFNATIAAAVDANSDRLVLYNTNAPTGIFLDLFGISDGVPGITVDGVALTPDFAPSGVLSTDGIHPNARGYGIIANAMLEVIEAKFGANLGSVNVLNLPSVTLCNQGDCASEQ